MRELLVAKSAGFCFGVSRSVKMAEEMLAAEANCYSLGELIHNDDVVQHLRSEGLTVADGPEQIPQGASVAKFAELLGVRSAAGAHPQLWSMTPHSSPRVSLTAPSTVQNR